MSSTNTDQRPGESNASPMDSDFFVFQPDEDQQLTAQQKLRRDEMAERRHNTHSREVARRADLIFGWLLIAQWIGGIVAAILITPSTWIGATPSIHVHLWAALLLGGAVCLIPAAMAFYDPSASINKYVISIAQMLYSALLIHLTGGRIETHFHVFGVLAFIALYRDWKAFIPATIIVALDHAARGIFWPQSVFGVAGVESWRWVEHGAWVGFEVSILSFACIQMRREMKEMALHWAQLQISKQVIESEVDRQTQEIWDAQSAIRASEVRLRSVIMSANDAFISVDHDGVILEWSPSAEELFEWPAAEVRKKSIAGILGETLANLVLNGNSGEAQEIRRTRFECQTRTRSGKEIPVEASVASSDASEKPVYHMFVHDISSRKSMQSRLLHAEKMEGIGQLAAGIAHEINTPTQFTSDNISFIESSFQSIGQLLSQVDEIQTRDCEKGNEEAWAEYQAAKHEMDLPYLLEEVPLAISQSKDGVRRIAEITSAMKSFSHPGCGNQKTSVDLSKAIQDAATVCRNEWKQVAEMQFHFAPDLTDVPAFPSELNQVLLNLIVNAAHAIAGQGGQKRGQIDVTTQRTEDWAVIRVQDNGPGIPEAIRRKIFEPFFTTKPVGKGTGQGLAIAHAVVVEKHGGEIEVESEVGSGAAFIVRLPLKSTEPADQETRDEEANLVCG